MSIADAIGAAITETDTAVDAAARALDPETMGSAGLMSERFKAAARLDARRALEAAAPHIAAHLAAKGYGDVRAALLKAADAMDAREGVGDSTDWTTDLGYYGEAAWLRHRAMVSDPEGRALVQAIHERKAKQ